MLALKRADCVEDLEDFMEVETGGLLNGVIAPFIEMGSKSHFTSQDTLHSWVPDDGCYNHIAISDCCQDIRDSTDLNEMIFNVYIHCCHVDSLYQINRINMMLV